MHALAAADEYRLINFPAVAGEGDRPFAARTPAGFRFTLVEPAGQAVLSVLCRARGKKAGNGDETTP